jgi:hypothetical protein
VEREQRSLGIWFVPGERAFVANTAAVEWLDSCDRRSVVSEQPGAIGAGDPDTQIEYADPIKQCGQGGLLDACILRPWVRLEAAR